MDEKVQSRLFVFISDLMMAMTKNEPQEKINGVVLGYCESVHNGGACSDRCARERYEKLERAIDKLLDATLLTLDFQEKIKKNIESYANRPPTKTVSVVKAENKTVKKRRRRGKPQPWRSKYSKKPGWPKGKKRGPKVKVWREGDPGPFIVKIDKRKRNGKAKD